MARDGDSRRHGGGPARGEHGVIQGQAGIAVRRILFLAQAEVLHVVRDRATLAQVLIVPIAQLLILANAATFEIRNTPTYVVDLDRTSTSRGIVTRLEASGHFYVLGASASPELANEALLTGRATMVLTVPHDFEASLVRAGVAPVQLSVNAEKGSAAGIVQAYASRILADYSAELTDRFRPGTHVARSGFTEPSPQPGTARIDVRARGWYNATLNYQHYMVPGILVALVTLIGTLLTAQNIAREKELGTLEQLNVTPITKGQFIAAKLLPFWGLAMIELAIGLVVGVTVFDVPVRGSLLLLFGVAAVYLATALGIGLWISTIVDTQQQAMFVTFFVMNVYLLMSGLFTPIDSMAPWVQTLSELNPVRHFVTISRAVLVKGAGIAAIERPLALLVVSAMVVLLFAIRQYSKRAA
jgi:ABC-2 type transport system permease protein